MAITNEVGAILEKRHFDAWGAITKVQDGIGNTLNGLTILDRGYTGHEHLQSVNLIHMNGRLYDPKLHRFLQPDNYVQDPNNTQNYNRYGYVLNNPLKYTDPSGELSFKSIGKWIEKNANDVIAGAAIVAGVVLVAAGVVTFGTTGYLGGALIGLGVSHFAATYEEYKKTGDWNAASKSAGIFFGISFSTDFGYGNENKANGVTQNKPVVKPTTVDRNGAKSDGFDEHLTALGNSLTVVSTYLATLEKFAISNASYIYKYGTTAASAAQLTLKNHEFQMTVAKWAPFAGDLVGLGGLGISYYQYKTNQIGGLELSFDTAATLIGSRGGWFAVGGIVYFGGKGIWNYYNPKNPLFPVPIKN